MQQRNTFGPALFCNQPSPNTIHSTCKHFIRLSLVHLCISRCIDHGIAGDLIKQLTHLCRRGNITLSVTDRLSNHSRGRAIDIYLLGDQRVIDSHDRASLAYEIATWGAKNPLVYELGSPWSIGGATANSFTNTVHHDHIHIGVRG